MIREYVSVQSAGLRIIQPNDLEIRRIELLALP